MWLYFELISFKSLEEIQRLRDAVADGMNPRDVKFLLGEEIVERFYDRATAQHAREEFISRFREGMMPEQLDENSGRISRSTISIRLYFGTELRAFLIASRSDLRMPEPALYASNAQKNSTGRRQRRRSTVAGAVHETFRL